MKLIILLLVITSIFIFSMSSGAIYASNDTASDLLKSGYEKLTKRDPAAAIEHFNKAISIDSSNSYAHTGLGNAYTQTGDTKAAIENFNKAISINPNNSSAYVSLWNLYSSRGDATSMLKKEEILKKLEKLDKSLADKISRPTAK